MPNITYKCPSCGGALAYNPADGKYTCEYCLSSFDDTQLGETESQNERVYEGTSVYTCPSCGAELVTDDTTAATMCYYCHNPVVLTGRLSEDWTPDCVIPFSVDRDTAKKQLIAWIKKHKYVPSDFANEKNLDTITGVYYPYWLADYDATSHFDGEGTTSSTSTTPSYYITTRRYYHVVRSGDIEYRNVQRPALTKADRKLSDGIHPYDYSMLEPFKNGYLAGFMAEKRDVAADEVKESVENELLGYAKGILTDNCKYESLSGNTNTEFKSSEYRYALLPAWIMTYKKRGDDTVYYYAMNGQNRNICGALPLDSNKLLRTFFIIAAIISALLCLGGYFIW